jgi:hypothetical protein
MAVFCSCRSALSRAVHDLPRGALGVFRQHFDGRVPTLRRSIFDRTQKKLPPTEFARHYLSLVNLNSL